MASLLTEAILTLSNFCGTKLTTSPNDSEPYLQNTMPQCLKQKGSKLQFITWVFALKHETCTDSLILLQKHKTKIKITSRLNWAKSTRHKSYIYSSNFSISEKIPFSKLHKREQKSRGSVGVSTALPPQTARVFIATVHQSLLFTLIRLQNIVPT